MFSFSSHLVSEIQAARRTKQAYLLVQLHMLTVRGGLPNPNVVQPGVWDGNFIGGTGI
jgi:hypothetical protein